MSMPTEEQLQQALAEAARMREQGDDPHNLAHVLLNYHYRLEQMERLQKAVEHYLHSGMAVREHQKLTTVLEEVRRGVDRTGHVERDRFGVFES